MKMLMELFGWSTDTWKMWLQSFVEESECEETQRGNRNTEKYSKREETQGQRNIYVEFIH